MADINITNGVVLDPFSLLLTGLMRKNRGIKSDLKSQDLFELAHGEARFKQAFINACHFAESMTVVGPVAQLAWNLNSTDYIEPALRWRASLSHPGNEYFAQEVKDFLTKASWNNVESGAFIDGGGDLLLHTLPDFTLKRGFAGDKEFKRWGDQSGPLSHFLYREGSPAYRRERQKILERLGNMADITNASNQSEINTGQPVVGLMAVTFTFKKPTGVLSIGELTNLASWPPVTFFLPTLLPSGATLQNNGFGGLGDRTVCQPAMSTYRIALQNDKAIMPYGQPFLLTSVKEQGKAPDILRSLSDVFKALWSQATLYSAWNMSFEADLEAAPMSYYMDNSSWKKFVGEFALEPMGAGRRIRGHNRHMSKYNLTDVSCLWEEEIGEPHPQVCGFNLSSVDKRPFLRQLRRTRLRPKVESIFVLPSYLSEGMRDDLMPVAMGMARFQFIYGTGLEGFLASDVLNNLGVKQGGDGDNDPTGHDRNKSFVDHMAQAMGKDEDKKNIGALPVTRVKGDIAFDPEGDPIVFGLSMNKEVLDLLGEDSQNELTDESYTKIASDTGVLGNFHFLDAFCSTSTKDLTQVFGEIKKKSFKEGSKASKLLDEALSIDLFDEDIGML